MSKINKCDLCASAGDHTNTSGTFSDVLIATDCKAKYEAGYVHQWQWASAPSICLHVIVSTALTPNDRMSLCQLLIIR